MASDQAGALKHARRYGDRLVCVRYRHDTETQQRYTTVELIVDHGPLRLAVAPTRPKIHLVALRLGIGESALRALLHAHGAVWDGKARLWYLHRTLAKSLGLLNRIV